MAKLPAKTKSRMSIVLIIGILLIMLGFIVWIVSLFSVQTAWKQDLSKLTACLAEGHSGTLEMEGESVLVGTREIDYFQTFLTMPKSMATERSEPNAPEALTLRLPTVTLSFAPAEHAVSTRVS